MSDLWQIKMQGPSYISEYQINTKIFSISYIPCNIWDILNSKKKKKKRLFIWN